MHPRPVSGPNFLDQLAYDTHTGLICPGAGKPDHLSSLLCAIEYLVSMLPPLSWDAQKGAGSVAGRLPIPIPAST